MKASRRRILIWAGAAGLLVLAGTLVYQRWIFGPPHYAYPGLGRSPDQELPAKQTPRLGVDLATRSADDFPEFLGAGRRAAVDHIELDPDWGANPPRLLWRQRIGAGWSAFAVANGFAVTMEQRGPSEQLTCYSAATGLHHWTVDWKERFPLMGIGPRSTPTIDEGRVYALGAWGHLVCVDGNAGRAIWERELLADLGLHWSDENRSIRFGRAGSPLVTEKMVIVPGGGLRGKRASLLAYDKLTGKPLWRGGTEQISYSSPVLVKLLGQKQVLIVNENTVSGHSLADGTELWSYKWPGNSRTDANVSQPVALSTSRVLISSGYHRGAAVIELSRATPNGPVAVRKVWRRRTVLCTKLTNVVTWKNHAYGLSDGVLECVDLEEGERRWKAGDYGHGQILRVRDLLLILGETGTLTLVYLSPAPSNHVLGSLQALTGTTYNNMALHGRLLLLRNSSEAACYELALRPE
ncbi:PQQ-binding-like beta-propeller repeat protein [Verrucomicrobiota bacterium]